MYSKRYMKKILTDPLPDLPEDERIYLNVPYKARSFAKATHCGFDSIRKLWFTGPHNAYIISLIDLYGINEETSEKAKALLKLQLETNTLKDKKPSGIIDDNQPIDLE